MSERVTDHVRAAGVVGGAPNETSSPVPSGVGPLDERTGGLDAGGLHLLSSPPVPARTALALQFLDAGLEAGEDVALVTRTRPGRVLAAAERFGLDLEAAWRERRLRIVGFRGDYEVRLRRAASPEEVYVELASLISSDASRVVFDPGTVLWEGRGEGSAASAFVDFVEDHPATVLATTTRGVEGDLPLSTELVSHGAAGILELHEEGNGLLRLSVRKLHGARPEKPDVTLALREGEGLTATDGAPSRRSSDRPGTGSDALLRLTLEGPLGEELEDWLRTTYRVSEADDPLDLVSRLQEDEPWGLVLISLGRERLEEGRRACSVCRRLRPGLPVVAVSDEPFRASDRADLLDAGADECMTGGVNVDELASRLELARARGGAAHPRSAEERGGDEAIAGEAGGGSEPAERYNGRLVADGAEDEALAGESRGEGPVADAAFRDEIRKELAESGARVFTVIRFAADDPSALPRTLSGLVRAEDGDFAGLLRGQPAVCLSGTAPSESRGFLRRVRGELEEAAGGPVEAEVLGSVRDAERLRELAG